MNGQERGLTISGSGEEPNFEYSANQKELSLDLYRFGCEAWKYIEGTDHTPSRHQQVLCDHLTHVRSKRVMRMLLNIPPSCGKSTWICAIFPAWVWTRFPGYNLTLYSDHPKLVKRDMTKCRDLLRSKWYQYNFPQVRVRRGHDQKYEFGLTEGGGYTGTTPGSSISTGTHPDILLFEDPQTREQAESLVEREALNDWFFETMGSRGIGKDAAQVVSQQRFQLKDLSGAIIEKYEQELKEDGYRFQCCADTGRDV